MTVGVASAVLVANPPTLPLFVVAGVSGLVGGMIPDIDVDTTDAHEGAFFVTLITAAAVIAVIVLDRFYGTGITDRLMSDSHRWRTIIAGLIFVAVCAVGKSTKHRSFMHSLLAMVLLSAMVYIIYPTAMLPFAVGYASHLAIDLLNRKGEQLFFPIPKRMCLDLCDSNGIVNHILGIVGLVVCLYLVIVRFVV